MKIVVGSNDLTPYVDKFVQEHSDTTAIRVKITGAPVAVQGLTKEAYYIKTNIEVDQASAEDTTFTYEVDSIIADNQKNGGDERFTLEDPEEYFEAAEGEFINNTIVLKAGETSTTGYMNYVSKDASIGPDTTKSTSNGVKYNAVGFVIKETGNSGNYSTDTNLWVWSPMIKDKGGKLYAKFASKAELQAKIDAVNESTYEEAVGLLATAFTYDEMTFEHAKVGVQTGDANDFALWIVLFVMAAVATGAVALKRN